MKLTLVVGTRPNFVKISPIIKAIDQINSIEKKITYRLIHTGQHYDSSMSDDFFKELEIPDPSINLNCSYGSQNEQTACIMIGFEEELIDNRPDIVIVVGDVTSTMACCLVAKKMNIKVAHIEAGIRSFDRNMPEEINRLVTDSICDYFFTTSRQASSNLIKENINKDNIYFVGNTMIDCLHSNLDKIITPTFLEKQSIKPKEYFLLTLHRPVNVDNVETLKKILMSVNNFVQEKKIIFPIHPRTKKKLEQLKINFQNIIIVNPQKYLEFIYLMKNSIGVITDSGGVTEETTYLQIPCLTMRNSTERPETIEFGTNILVGDDLDLLENSIKLILNKKWKKGSIPELWDGKTSIRIVNNLLDIYNKI